MGIVTLHTRLDGARFCGFKFGALLRYTHSVCFEPGVGNLHIATWRMNRGKPLVCRKI